MPEKQKKRTWKDPKTIIAAASVTMLLTLWNIFASRDRQKTGDTDLFAATPSPSATPPTTSDDACPTPTETEKLGSRCVTVTDTRSS